MKTGLWRRLLGARFGFEGGLYLPEQKRDTARLPIQTITPDCVLRIPLAPSRGVAARAVVRVGDTVQGGQIVARAETQTGVDIGAPTSGRVTGMEAVWTAEDGLTDGLLIEPDGRDLRLPRDPGWTGTSFVDLLAGGGVMCPSPRAPLHMVLKEAIAADARTVILNGMETEPYLTAELRTLVEDPDRIIETACEIADAIGAMRVILAVPDRHRRVRRRLEEAVRGRLVEVIPLGNKYPQCHPVVLVKTLLDLEVPPGGSVLDVGVLVLPIAALRAAADPLLDGRPVTHTVLTAAGDAILHAGAYRVPIGMPMRRLIEHLEPTTGTLHAISGGPLTGVAVQRDDAVVTATTTAVLVFREARIPEPLPCVHCGWCVEDCPVGLDPASLMQLESEPACSPTELTQMRVCIDCGLCSHVCPSELPLAATIRRGRMRFEPPEPATARAAAV